MCNHKGKKHRRASSGGLRGNLPNTRGLKAAGVMGKPKGKQAQKACSLEVNPLHPEDISDNFRDGGVLEADPCMFTWFPFQHFTNDIYYSIRHRQ